MGADMEDIGSPISLTESVSLTESNDPTYPCAIEALRWRFGQLFTLLLYYYHAKLHTASENETSTSQEAVLLGINV
jgi:hypothetical protein